MSARDARHLTLVARRVPPWLLLAAGALVLLCLLPWPFAHKVHAVLHGLCAQRPSHSLTLGDRLLPFDARMTGIYGGFFTTALYLVARGRLFAPVAPSRLVLGVLTLFVGLLAVDGFNSLLTDLRLWHPYEPRNLLRLATGLGTGIALAVAIAWLIGTTLWVSPRDHATVDGVWEVGLLTVLQLPFALLVLSGTGWLYVPVSLLLTVSAWLTVAGLMLVVTVLVQRRDGTYRAATQLHRPATTALMLALVVMGVLAAGRFWLEQITGTPPLM